MRSVVCLALLIGLAACVAPEQAPTARSAVTRSTTPPAASAAFEDAPLPNRKMVGSTNDSVVRLAR